MSEEEIRKALEIIKQPITVNCIEYKYFDRENYDKLISVYDNCLWIVNLFEQAKEHIEPIKQENERLQNNWNELKKWLEEDNYKVFEEIWVNTQEVLDKMQELEQGKDERNN